MLTTGTAQPEPCHGTVVHAPKLCCSNSGLNSKHEALLAFSERWSWIG